ncbi:MAG: hypothetical protein ACI9KE_006599, partial [Polyangiales bacterium]
MKKNKTFFCSLLSALLFVGCGDDSSRDAGSDSAMSDALEADAGSCAPRAG